MLSHSLLLLSSFLVLGMEAKAFRMLGKYTATEPHPQPVTAFVSWSQITRLVFSLLTLLIRKAVAGTGSFHLASKGAFPESES